MRTLLKNNRKHKTPKIQNRRRRYLPSEMIDFAASKTFWNYYRWLDEQIIKKRQKRGR
ncbi:MAG: hypothetical protein R3B95_19245 [Nitrospirales bacterium]|nr:hypothetical protein [Nitrospirales bacterium]